MNRSELIDSIFELDFPLLTSDSVTMTDKQIELHFQRRDAARNMARHYALSLQPTLFGELAIVRAWGRIGTRGQQKLLTFSSHSEATAKFEQLALRRRRRGYTE